MVRTRAAPPARCAARALRRPRVARVSLMFAYMPSHPPHHALTLRPLSHARAATGLPPFNPPSDFIGYVSLAVSKRIVESGRLEKCVTLVEGYRAFLMYHVQVCDLIISPHLATSRHISPHIPTYPTYPHISLSGVG